MKATTDENKLGFLNLLVLVLSIYVLIALFIDTIFKLPTEISRLLYYTDNAICAVFFYDFCIRFYKAENKKVFMYWGWIDLISCIPTFEYLRAGRAVRLIRMLRILRAFRSTKQIVYHIFKNRAKGVLTTVSIIAILLVIFSSIAILQVEKAPNSNIKTAEDALWWSYVTITTVGYGDKYPVTTEGRMIAVVLMTAGVGLFGTFTAYVSSWFIASKRQDKKSDTDIKID
jgi:voltage-gated potassium channel